MTIIRKTPSLVNYPYLVIPADVVIVMQRCLTRATPSATDNLLKCFEAYCHVTGCAISYLTLSSPSFLGVAKGFLGALADESFLSGTQPLRNRYAREFNKLLDEMKNEIPLLRTLTEEEKLPSNNKYIWAEQKSSLDTEAVHYWNGWEVKGRKDGKSYLPICLLWNSHGREFAEKIYNRYAQYVEKHQAPAHSEFNLFIIYLSENASKWPESTFHNPIKLKKLFIHNMVASFKTLQSSGGDLASKTIGYAQFIYHMEEAFIQPGVWARPFAGMLPHPVVRTTPGHKTNIKKLPDGTLVKEKLITPIPLEITDSEAIEIIFKTIKSDNHLVLEWAKKKLTNLKQAQNRRRSLARTGAPIYGGKNGKKSLEEVGINDICATFEKFGLPYIREKGRHVYGRSNAHTLTELLAIPTAQHFFALQIILVAGHPCLTEAFFTNFELHNKRGNLSGFLETDTGHQLVGYKDRKGGRLSEQVIPLTSEEEKWVRLIISATKPLRNELKNRGNDAWRFLFLRCTRHIGPPKPASPFIINKDTFERNGLFAEFLAISRRSQSDTKELLLRLSVTTYRASQAVEVYLNTNSVETMAKALGHTTYNSSLLSRYLPEPILAFFQTRWIRVFQRGIICEAMKGSPNLLRAAQFTNMEDLHVFLENHAIRPLPVHLQDPDTHTKRTKKPGDSADSAAEEQVLVPIDTGTLTVLLSINLAVSSAQNKTNLCAKAIYWSKFAELVIRDIESGFNSDLQNYLNIAQHHADAAQMEKLIYEATARA
ncbi:hypothetical protein L0026_32885 (plasmid) [Pseudomonas aeruginosa]|uniref:hypothetical protein n=1 Tax=Pseudomonas aeruginosa TaxID=287 RepID=UPI000EB1114D|nr:hypothetical protein [Pseudomonas aeruginosa]MCT4938198.1 hypothetical protein [Pseudomonas aeruginosa]NNB82280.1 hypothetical protein [Pseudomonas aeruginosa]RUB24708.1 hypothetical protein IPC1432_27655 [Pseudomonas aeruginosa]RUD97222.1 hypothetical protein IPC1228_24070 [Pseudomonas aeruginosa]UPG14069.1 hypothetical protein L0026_05285 [Pseudomonas aeruginosa]